MGKIMQYIHDRWLSVILLMTLILFFVWLFAFFANGLFNCHFDLSSCWAGVGAITAAATAGWGKWLVDSWLNTNQGEKP